MDKLSRGLGPTLMGLLYGDACCVCFAAGLGAPLAGLGAPLAGDPKPTTSTDAVAVPVNGRGSSAAPVAAASSEPCAAHRSCACHAHTPHTHPSSMQGP